MSKEAMIELIINKLKEADAEQVRNVFYMITGFFGS